MRNNFINRFQKIIEDKECLQRNVKVSINYTRKTKLEKKELNLFGELDYIYKDIIFEIKCTSQLDITHVI